MSLAFFYIWEDARVWACWRHSVDIFLNYLRPVSCLFPSWIPLRVHHWGWLQWLMIWWPKHPLFTDTVRGTTDQNHPPWPGMMVITCMSYLTTGGPGKERRTNKPPPTGRIRERSKEERRCQSICPTNLSESFSLESILAEWWVCHQEGPWVKVIGQRQPRN